MEFDMNYQQYLDKENLINYNVNNLKINILLHLYFFLIFIFFHNNKISMLQDYHFRYFLNMKILLIFFIH